MTEAEKFFWEFVREKNFLNKKFRRQHPIKFEMDGIKRHFIADFYCFEEKLVIELDGGIHKYKEDYDKLRTFIINQLGLRVIRFTNNEILKDFEKVQERLRDYLTPATL